MPPEVFVSYARKDQDRVISWVRQLEAAGISVWIDRRGIAAGFSWQEEIIAAIDGCKLLLLMISAHSVASREVATEVTLAREGRKAILPLYLEPVEIPPALRWPLAGLHHLDLFDEQGGDLIEELLRALARWGITPAKELSPPPSRNVPNNLPRQLTRFIGRERETAAAKRLLSSAALVTLTGPGGVGKTRLALQVAAELLDDFPDGLFVVELAPITDPGLVPSAIASTLGVREGGEQPILEPLKDHLRDRQMLLVLDNFEQVLNAATVVSDLLAAAPRLKILVTSRALLNLRGEHDFPVTPLPLPDLKRLPPAEALPQYAAVELFIQRAVAAKPDFAINDENALAVAEICHRADGLPLAVELAAARIRLFPPQVLLSRLDNRLKLLIGGAQDRPTRQQTLRNAIGWSYDLLGADEQTLFRRLAVFVGGCTLEAAEAVCSGEGDLQVEVLDGVASLLDKSLLWQEETAGRESRFKMLETIREYGLERLRESGAEEASRQRHAEYYLGLAEAAEPMLVGVQQGECLVRLEAEHDNFRAVIDWVRCRGDAQTCLRLGGALWRFWHLRGYLREGRERLEAALAMPAAAAGTRARARALNGAAALAHDQGALQQAATLSRESLMIARELHDDDGIAVALNHLGNAALDEGRIEEARDLYQEAWAIWRTNGNIQATAMVLHNLASLAHDRGEMEVAKDLFTQSLDLKQQCGDQYGIACTLNNLGEMALRQGDYTTAAERLEDSLRLFQELGDRYGIAMSLDCLAKLAFEQGDLTRALELHRDCLRLCEQLENRQAIADSLDGLACTLAALGRSLSAAGLAGAAEALQESIGSPPRSSHRTACSRGLAAARARVEESAWEAAWAEGRRMSLPQVIGCAIQEVSAALRG